MGSRRNSPCPCGSGRKFKQCCGSSAVPPAPCEEDALLAARELLEYVSVQFPEHYDAASELFWGPLERMLGPEGLERLLALREVRMALICFVAVEAVPPGAEHCAAASVLDGLGAELALGVRRALGALIDARVTVYDVQRVAVNGALVVSPAAGGPTVEVADSEGRDWSPGDVLATRIAGPPTGARMIGGSHRFPPTFRERLVESEARGALDSRTAFQLWMESRIGGSLGAARLSEGRLDAWFVRFAVHDSAAVEELFAEHRDRLEPTGLRRWRWTPAEAKDGQAVEITLAKKVLVGAAPGEELALAFRAFVEDLAGERVTHDTTHRRDLVPETDTSPIVSAEQEPTQGPLNRGSRYPHLAADLRRHLDGEDLSSRLPKKTRTIGLYLGRITAAISTAPRGELFDIRVACRRRPKNRSCAPELVACIEEDGHIHWQCPSCGDSGSIAGWERTPFDQRDRDEIAGRSNEPGTDTRVLVIRPPDHRRLLGLSHLTGPALRLLMSDLETVNGTLRLVGTCDELVALARCIAFHFARTRDLSRATADILHDLHHALTQFADARPDLSQAAQCAEVLLFERSRRTGPRPAPRPEAGTYLLDVRLQDIAPSIWRHIEVPGDFTLEDLYETLILAFGWADTHPHAFQQGQRLFARPHPDDFRPVTDERSVRICDVLPDPSATLLWEYDFGDSWRHEITVEAILPTPSDIPRLITGARAAPPEDCGGPPGYERLLQILSDPFHEEHEFVHESSDEFDPEEFDLETFAERLARMTPAGNGRVVDPGNERRPVAERSGPDPDAGQESSPE